MNNNKKRLVILDGNALLHRAYHALPPLKTKKGELVNAVYGFLLVLFKSIKQFQPDFIIATFDLPFPTFRDKIYKDYKAQRPKTPEDLAIQIPKVKEILKAFPIPIYEKQGFEADDIIGTISQIVSKNDQDIEIIIITGDQDVLQLIDDNTKVYLLKRGVKEAVLYDESLVEEHYQVAPKKIPDLKALNGDASDNIPGVPGIGPKTAKKLIKEFGSLDNLYREIQKSSKIVGLPDSLKEKLLAYQKQAFFSKKLAEIKRDVAFNFNITNCQTKDYNEEKIKAQLEEFGFHSLIKRLPQVLAGEGNQEEDERNQSKPAALQQKLINF